MTRVGIYLRISLDKTGEHLGVDRQRAACLEVIKRFFPTAALIIEYLDNSVSASKTRPATSDYARLVADVRAGRLDAVIVWDIDRLSRIPREIEDWIDFGEHHGVRLITTDGECDTSTENGRMFLRIKAAVTRHEIEMKSKRQRAAAAQAVDRGMPPIGKRAIGWERDGMTLVPVEADAIRAAAAAILAGASLRSVARTWTAAGLRTAGGGDWHTWSVRTALLNPRVAGLRARQTGRDQWQVARPGVWPAILPEETWRAVDSVLRDPSRRTTPGTARVSLLSGLALCGVCGSRVTTGCSRFHKRTYKCLPVLHLARLAEPVEAWVSEVIVARLSRADAADLLRPDVRVEIREVRAELAAVRVRLDGLAGLVADGTLTPDQVRPRAAGLRDRAVGLEARLADAGRVDALAPLIAAGDVRERWAALDLDVRRSLVGGLTEVTIYSPGQGVRMFDPSTVDVRWV